MHSTYKICFLFIFSFLLVSPVLSQDDETRQQSGLPTFIGNRPGANRIPGADATISGSLLIQGIDEQKKQPSYTVSIVANGTLVARQVVRNRGGFSFTDVPRNGVALVVEADGLEIGRYQLGTLNPPPLGNRHDVIVNGSSVSGSSPKNEVVSASNLYKRTADNQKLFERALEAKKAKQNAQAIDLFKQLVNVDSSDYVALTELGSVYFVDEKYPAAESAYKAAIEKEKNFAPALLNLGKLHLSQKHFDQAIEVLEAAVAKTPNSADVNQFLGEAYLQSKKGSKAVVYLDKAIELEPIEKAEVHLRLASLYNAANLKDRAVAEYVQFIKKVPDHPEKSKIEKYIKDNPPK